MITDPFKRYRNVYTGLCSALEESASYTDQIPKKLARMQELYLARNPYLYDKIQVRKLRYYQAALAYKDLIVAFRLEELWCVVHSGPGDRPLLEVLRNVYDEHHTADEHITLLSFTLDDFLLQATAFLDFYMPYLRAFFQLSDDKKLSERKLMGALGQIDDPAFLSKATIVREFLQQRVFTDVEIGAGFIAGWGTVLRTLRNSVIHRDMLYPTFATGEKLVDKVTQQWPRPLREIDTVRFAQDIQNDMFSMITSMAELLYELEWKPGPYRADLWDS